MRLLYFSISTLILFAFPSCKEKPSSSSEKGSPIVLIPEPETRDPHSYSNPEEVKVTHLQLDLAVDFETSVLSGIAIYTLDNKQATKIILDTRDMDIVEVRVGDDPEASPVDFTMGKVDKLFGQSLTIPIEPTTESITIQYRTRPEAAALQWLSPAQANQSTPFLYTQSQAILARSWIPCQDSPGVRFTYNARVKVPANMMAVMSASNPTMTASDGIYVFTMNQPIPSYLMALAVGDIVYRPYGRRAGVYAQPNVLLSAAWEFEDTERMMEVAETLYGPYQWDRYDLLVLPPSFPFGGMENPRLTFLTPSVLAGDRSLTTIVAHELAHSWSGNLVTNATWNDFWLNEGFTVYFERRIMEALYGKDLTEMLAALGYQNLIQTIESKGWDHPDTRLKLDLAGRNPDEGLTRIAYDKGCLFLRTMEQIYGREKVDAVLLEWFQEHAFKSVTTEQFVAHLRKVLPEKGAKLLIDEWVYGTGLPSNAQPVTSPAFDQVNASLAQLEKDGNSSAIDTTGWRAQMWLHFLRHLPDNANMADLDKRFEFSTSENSEYLAAWFEQALKKGYGKEVSKPLEKFLMRNGRRKFLTVLYKAMLENDMGQEARAIYEKARPGYHTVATETLDKLFGK